MNTTQQKAAMQLQRALAACAKAKLTGGVFDTHFCVWPCQDKSPFEWGEQGWGDFFDGVKKLGGDTIDGHGMSLDGGAGN